MDNIIRFAWGTSALGDYMLATSSNGIVALDFGSNRATKEQALRVRFPECEIINGQDEMSGLLEQVRREIENPRSRSELALDLRGTPYDQKVWSMLREIPAGQTTSYGALAAELGTRDARDVTDSIASNPIAVLIPCHRVIKKDGSISGYRWGVWRKRELLAREQQAGEFQLV